MTVLIGSKDLSWYWSEGGGGGGAPRSLELMFTGYVPLASQSPYSIIVYFWPIIEPILVIYAPTLSMWFQAAERNAVNAILLLN